MTRSELEKYAAKCGIDRIGIAPVNRFKELPPQFSPLSIFPEMRSVIVCVQEIPRGIFRGVEEGTLWQRAPRQISPHDMYEFARYLEDSGCLAVPCSPLAQERWPEGIKFRQGNVEPNVYPSLEYAAVAAGLGEIGYAGLFLTPQFGIRQSLGMLITDLDIAGDPLFDGTVCDRCGECAASCPMGAALGETAVRILDRTFTCAAFNRNLCSLCPNGAFPDTTSDKAMPNRLTAACGRACLAHLDSGGKLEKKYKSPFRRRPAWGMTLEELR
jgi:epoxyqueuosine reductase QueG